MSLHPLRPGDVWRYEFTLEDSSGAPVNYDAGTGKAVVYLAGAAQTTAITIAQATDNASGTITGTAGGAITGAYQVSFTASSGWSLASGLTLLLECQVGGVKKRRWVGKDKLVQWGATALPNAAAAAAGGVGDVLLWRGSAPLALTAGGLVWSNPGDFNNSGGDAVANFVDWLNGNDQGFKVNATQIGSQNVTAAAGITFGATVAAVGSAMTLADGAITAAKVAAGVLPANFSALGINASGHLSRVTLADAVTDVTNRVTANADQFGGQAVTAAAPVTVPASIGTSTLDAAGVRSALTAQGYTDQRAANLDHLDADVDAIGGLTPDQDTKLTAIYTSTGQMAMGVRQEVAPVQTGTLTVIQGDSYLNADGTAIRIAKAANAPWPTDLTGWTITVGIQPVPATTADPDSADAPTLSLTGAVVTATGDDQAIRFDLTAAESASLVVPSGGGGGTAAYRYDVRATSGSQAKTLEVGVVNVVEDAG